MRADIEQAVAAAMTQTHNVPVRLVRGERDVARIVGHENYSRVPVSGDGLLYRGVNGEVNFTTVRSVDQIPLSMPVFKDRADVYINAFMPDVDSKVKIGVGIVAALLGVGAAAVYWPSIAARIKPAYPDGTLVKGSGPETYVVQGGHLKWVPSPAAFTAAGYDATKVQTVPDAALAAVPVAAPSAPVPDGSLLKGPGPEIYVVRGGQRHWIPDPATFAAGGYDATKVQNVSVLALNSVPIGAPLAAVPAGAVPSPPPASPAAPTPAPSASSPAPAAAIGLAASLAQSVASQAGVGGLGGVVQGLGGAAQGLAGGQGLGAITGAAQGLAGGQGLGALTGAAQGLAGGASPSIANVDTSGLGFGAGIGS